MKTKAFLSAAMTFVAVTVGFSQATQSVNGITAGSYLGTSNANDVIFKRNLEAAGQLGTLRTSFGVNSATTNYGVSIGVGAGRYATGGGSQPGNTYIGYNAGSGDGITSNTGKDNVYIGKHVGSTNTTGSENVCIGSQGPSMTSGNANVIIGHRAGNGNLTGGQNVYLGNYSGYSATSASGNVFLGNYAGQTETGSNLLYIENSSTSSPLIWGNFSTDQLKLNGKTGIGMPSESFPTTVGGTNVQNYNLFVRGGILADEVRVRTTWSDYVFESDYKLPTLEDVEKHIKEKGYLINVPSGKTVETDGIEVGQMAKIQQEKIEELTLYVIEQNKINKQQAQEIAELKAMVEALAAKK